MNVCYLKCITWKFAFLLSLRPHDGSDEAQSTVRTMRGGYRPALGGGGGDRLIVNEKVWFFGHTIRLDNSRPIQRISNHVNSSKTGNRWLQRIKKGLQVMGMTENVTQDWKTFRDLVQNFTRFQEKEKKKRSSICTKRRGMIKVTERRVTGRKEIKLVTTESSEDFASSRKPFKQSKSK